MVRKLDTSIEACRCHLTFAYRLSCSGRMIKDIKWFFYFSTVFLLFVGAGAPCLCTLLLCGLRQGQL